jgi:CRP-like cAMP-binding protein
VLLLTQQQLYEAIEVSPGVAIYIIRILCKRVNQMNQALSEFQGQRSG